MWTLPCEYKQVRLGRALAFLFLATTLLISALHAQRAGAQEATSPAAGGNAADSGEQGAASYRSPLFNGKDLTGWQVTGCKAAVEDGMLVILEGDGFVRTDHRFADFILEWSCRPRKADSWDSGVYFRSELPTDGKPWPKRYQINLKQGAEGNAIGLPEAKSTGLVEPGQWNRFKLTVIGDRAALEINGKPAWDVKGVEGTSGYIGIQVEVPIGGQFEFRDLAITELGKKSLFNGTDLAGWEGGGSDAAECWKVTDGLLECTGQKGPWLRSKEEYADFNFRLEYKLLPGGNSGVYLRVPENGRHWEKDEGVEVQILDDAAPRYAKLEPGQYSASVYKIAPANPRVSRAAGEWNTMEIDCRGTTYVVYHNGHEVVRATAPPLDILRERRLAGFLGLQNHSEQVWFRNLRIGPSLETAAPSGAPAPSDTP